jgi:hypothetical protein
MPVFDPKEFALIFDGHVNDLLSALAPFKIDIATIKALPSEQRKNFVKEWLNHRIDIPLVPEGVEGLLFGFIVEFVDAIIEKKLGGAVVNPS